MFELTREEIDKITERVRGSELSGAKVDVVKAVKEALGLGIKEALIFVNTHQSKVADAVRKELEDRAGLSGQDSGRETAPRVFEDECFRLIVKKSDVPFDAINEFFARVVNELLPAEPGE